MKQHDQELQLIAYLLGDLDADQVRALESSLAGSESLRKEMDRLSVMINGLDNLETKQPSAALNQKFYQQLNRQSPTHTDQSAMRRNLYRLSAAAVVLILVGVFIGSKFMDNGNQQLAAHELTQTKQAMHVLLDESSTSKRIEAVNASYTVKSADTEILEILFRVLREDESTSVRLAALDALAQFIGTSDVSLELARSLSFQENQVVQIALINMLVDLQEVQAIPELEELIEKENVDQNVKDQARLGLFKML